MNPRRPLPSRSRIVGASIVWAFAWAVAACGPYARKAGLGEVVTSPGSRAATTTSSVARTPSDSFGDEYVDAERALRPERTESAAPTF